MRADRLVAALLVLQARGRVTAGELAAELEVSLKTARRDLEALAMAGIPVYSQPGRRGGWSLLGGARTDLSGLTATEAQALFLVAGPSAAATPEVKAALRKLVRALPESFRARAEAAASTTVLDATSWGHAPGPPPTELEMLRHAVIDRVQLRLAYANRHGATTRRLVHPLGVAQKGRAWYLVADTDAGLRTFRVDRIQAVERTDRPARRPEPFDLGATWRSVVDATDRRRRRVSATVRVRQPWLPGLRDRFGDDLVQADPAGEDAWQVEIRGASAETLANELAGWGDDIEVIRPAGVRRRLCRIGAELVRRYGSR